MCRNKKTVPFVTTVALTSLMLFCLPSQAEQSDQGNIAFGTNAQATGWGAIAIGANSHARGAGSVVIGPSRGLLGDDRPLAVDGGIAIGSGSKSYGREDVNFGSRKLSGLLDGVADDEAVTVRQLNAAKIYTDTVKQEVIGLIAPSGGQMLSDAKAYSDSSKSEAIAQARKYTDASNSHAITVATQYVDAKNEKTLGSARAYADTARHEAIVHANKQTSVALSEARSYADRKAYTMLEDANSYADSIGRSVLKSANDFTEQRTRQARDQAIAMSRQYTDQRVERLQSQMKRIRKQANAGISGAMAMTALMPPPQGTNTSFGMAMATYRNQVAVASGFGFRVGKNSNIRLNTSWDSASGIGAAAGFNMAW